MNVEKALSASLAVPLAPTVGNMSFAVIAAISFAHLLNDMMQSVLLAIYPLLKESLQLNFAQIGLITLAFQLTASLLQPLIGLYTDRRPIPYSLPVAMAFTMTGLLLLAQAGSLPALLVAASLVGIGSSIFHPESSRVARIAAGGRHGLAQSLFQIGGNFGSAVGPLLAALIIVPRGQGSAGWFSLAALLGVLVLSRVGTWYKAHLAISSGKAKMPATHGLSRRQVGVSLGVLALLMFSKFFYMASFHSYYTFYLIEKFQLSVQSAQMYLFAFLLAVAVGTLAGGPIGDRIGRKRVIWGSILGVAPFALLLPHVGLLWTAILSLIIGLVLASAFAAIVVYAQDLLPDKVGAVSGLFFGLAFGMGGIGAALLGQLADATSLAHVYQLCAFLPLIGLLTVFLPNVAHPR